MTRSETVPAWSANGRDVRFLSRRHPVDFQGCPVADTLNDSWTAAYWCNCPGHRDRSTRQWQRVAGTVDYDKGSHLPIQCQRLFRPNRVRRSISTPERPYHAHENRCISEYTAYKSLFLIDLFFMPAYKHLLRTYKPPKYLQTAYKLR